MTVLTILTEKEQIEFDYPPTLPSDVRAFCFTLDHKAEDKIKRLRTSTNKVGFLLQYGYFKACKRFFITNRFRQEDIEYAAKLLDIPMHEVSMATYKKKIPTDHQKIILELFDYKAFDKSVARWLKKEVELRVKEFIEPHQLFFDLIQLLQDHRIALPSSNRLIELITDHYLEYEEKLLQIIKKKHTKKIRAILDKLLLAPKSGNRGILGSMKIVNQSTKPKAINAGLKLFKKIEDLFTTLHPVIKALNLTPNSCAYYATWVQKAKLSQIKQFPDKNKTYLHLIAFIQHQYYLRQDAFVDMFLKCAQSAKNSATRKLNESEQLSRPERRAAVRHVTKSNRSYKSLIDEITAVTKSPVLTDAGKVQKITDLIDEHEQRKNEIEQEKLELFEKSLDFLAKDKDYFDILEKLSIKLQRRVTGILNVLVFNECNSDNKLLIAIKHFVVKEKHITNTAPTGFLKEEEKEALMGDNGIRSSLYKILLFIHVADAIKSGELNLKYSYRYLSIQDYLIDENTWSKECNQLLKAAGLEHFADYEATISELKERLDSKYETVNVRFLGNRNPYLSVDEKGDVRVNTPALPDKDTEYIGALLGQVAYVPILQVLTEINGITHFVKSFKHHSIKNVKRRPRTTTFMAGIIGLGCNIGIQKMAQISSGVNENTLSNTVNWYFSKQTLSEANQCIVEMINKLALSGVFINDTDQLHSSGDGSKVDVGVESLLASGSFKYFGQGKGVSVYTFIDERQALFHSLVMSASEREAAYVIDGLNNISVPKISIHSTDTHGYTEAIFAATHFMGIAFAPRIKNLKKQRLYAFSSKKTYERKGYQILPSRAINQKLIAKYWEDILRFMATIKLKKITASQLFKRLSSYARNNPLYKAIKEFGRIIKSLFVLTYYDDVKLRQRVEKQLNRIELSNKFANAIFYANNSEFKQALREEQEITVLCRTLIQNAIVLWNYLYLSQLLVNSSDIKERNEMVGMIKEGSVLSWAHINLHGEFDFKRSAANETFFDMKKILALQVA